MNVLEKLPGIAAAARETWERGTPPADMRFEAVMDRYEGVRPAASGRAPSEPGRIITGDNLHVAKTLLAAVRAGTQDAPALIYMDPPFFTKERYSQKIRMTGAACGDIRLPVHAFSDLWGGADGAARGDEAFARYLSMLTERVTAAHDLLPDDGSLWIHLDHHAAHYVKILADHVFGGPEYMLNEVIWRYGSGGATKKHFARKHDTLLFYAKDPKQHKFYPIKEKSYNREGRPYRFKGVEEYRDAGGWYTLVNMRDVWRIDMIGRTSGERTGYATQKPESLLERIVSSCTAAGDLCVDLFGGSGTLAAVCEKAGRRWMTIDASPLASLHAERRMARLGAAFEILNGARSVADEAAGGAVAAPRWKLAAEIGAAPETGEASVAVRPTSYALPEIALGVDVPQAAALIGMAHEEPARFMAGVSAEIQGEGGSGDGPFRPQYAVYGADCLRLPARDAGKAVLKVRVTDVFGNAETQRIEVEP
jgi:DNA modification methylase